MMMGATVPGEDSKLALLRIVADPEKHQATLDALTKRIDEAATAEAAARAAQAEAATAKTEIDRAQADAYKAIAKREEEFTSALDAGLRTFADREAALDRRKDEHELAVASHAKREAELSKQEVALTGRARDLDARELELSARARDLDARDAATAKALREAQKARDEAVALRDEHESKLKQAHAALRSLG